MRLLVTACWLISFCALAHGTSEICVGPSSVEESLRLKPSPEGYTALGVQFAKRKQFTCAFQAFENSLKLVSDSWLTHYDYALALTAAGQPDRAIAELRKTTRLNPEFLDGHLALGDALKGQGSLEEAEREYRLALGIDSASVSANDSLAKIFIAQGRFSAAIPFIEELVKVEPRVRSHHLDLAVAWAESGNYTESRKILLTILASDPDLPEAHYNLGVVMAKERKFREAVAEFRACLAREPGNDFARMGIAVALHTVADDNEALPYIEEHVKRYPNDARGLALLGQIYRLTGNDEPAEKTLRRAVALAPTDAGARLDLGIVLANRRMLNLALEQLEKARDLDPDSADVHLRLAEIYKDLNQVDASHRELRQVQRLKLSQFTGDIGATNAARANQLLQNGDARAAADLYREALKSDPHNGRTYYNLSLALKALNDLPSEREALKKSIELDGNLASARDRMGALYMAEGQSDRAAAEFRAATVADPQAPEPMYHLGLLYATQGRNDAAEKCFREATENGPSYFDAYVMLANVIAAQGRFAEAEKPAEAAMKLAPKNTQALTMLGMIRTRLGHGDQALPLFREVVALEPAQSEAHLNLGIALADTLDLESAIREFAEAMRLAPENPVTHFNLGRALYDGQRYEEARRELRRTVQLDPRNGSSLYLMALIDRQGGNPANAVQLLKQVISIEPSNADAHFQLGLCFKEIGQDGLAIAEWRTTLRLGPGHEEASYNLSRLLYKTAPAESRSLRENIQKEQERQMAIDRASTLGNVALNSASQRDWPGAVAQFKEALGLCGSCTLEAQLRKNLGLTYARSGNLRDAVVELQKAGTLTPQDPDISKALHVIQAAHEAPLVPVP